MIKTTNQFAIAYNFPQFSMAMLPKRSSTRQVAAVLQLSVQCLYLWRQKGISPQAVRDGRSLVYRREEVLAWLRAQMEEQLDLRQAEIRSCSDAPSRELTA